MTFAPVPADPAAWHALRLKNIGGSESPALLGCQPDYALSPFALWAVKSGRIPAPPVDNERIRWGIAMEPVIAAEAAKDMGWTIAKGRYATDDECPGLAATLDYEITDAPKEWAEGLVGPGVLQIKNVDGKIFYQSWSAAVEGGDHEPPLHIILQVQHELAASAYQWGYVGALVGGNDLKLWPYRRRERVIDTLRERVTAFWQSVRDGKAPAVDGSDSTYSALQGLYASRIPASEAVIPDEAIGELHEAAAGLVIERAAAAAATERSQLHRNVLLAALAGAERGYIKPPTADDPAYGLSLSKNGRLSVKEILNPKREAA